VAGIQQLNIQSKMTILPERFSRTKLSNQQNVIVCAVSRLKAANTRPFFIPHIPTAIDPHVFIILRQNNNYKSVGHQRGPLLIVTREINASPRSLIQSPPAIL